MAGVSLEKARVRSRMIVSPRAMVKKKKKKLEMKEPIRRLIKISKLILKKKIGDCDRVVAVEIMSNSQTCY